MLLLVDDFEGIWIIVRPCQWLTKLSPDALDVAPATARRELLAFAVQPALRPRVRAEHPAALENRFQPGFTSCGPAAAKPRDTSARTRNDLQCFSHVRLPLVEMPAGYKPFQYGRLSYAKGMTPTPRDLA